MKSEAIDRAMIIPGMMWPTELHSLAHLFAESTRHVEIGSFCGKSLYAVAAGMSGNSEAEIWAVDNMSLTSITPSTNWCKSVLRSTLESINSTLGVRTNLMLGDSREQLRFLAGKQIDSAFIDAEHTFEDVCRDTLAVWPLLRRNGILAGHDYADNFIAVKDAVHAMFRDMIVVQPGTRIWTVTKNAQSDSLLKHFQALS